RVAEVIAVEPDDRMRAVLAARSPGARAVAGRGEAVPVPDASVDAVFVSSAWHWFDPSLAVPEIARVLRDGGRLGVLWTSLDREADWAAVADGLLRPAGARRAGGATRPGRPLMVMLPDSAPFSAVESASFTFTRTMTVGDAVDWIATYSAVITAPEAERAAGLARARESLLQRADADGLIAVPMRSTCWRADRFPRSASAG
ncbi:MAG: methyltransferase domain-containing protein, partial [Trebonia sp.]